MALNQKDLPQSPCGDDDFHTASSRAMKKRGNWTTPTGKSCALPRSCFGIRDNRGCVVPAKQCMCRRTKAAADSVDPGFRGMRPTCSRNTLFHAARVADRPGFVVRVCWAEQ